MKEWRIKNPTYGKKWRMKNKESCTKYRKEHRREFNIYQKKYQQKYREKISAYVRDYRHKKGITKKSRGANTGRSKTKEYRRMHDQKYRSLIKGGGPLTIQTIQQVYEDNIKHYGTLTCYLCLNPIEFGNDHLEHKIPLSRGGTNDRDNLNIAHRSCNCRKQARTEEEYKKEQP
jgi:5-methylcytosine-specific restriction endonuclease McrA